MAHTTVTLIHGYKVGDQTLKDAVVREFSTADLIDAEEESEKLHLVPDEKGVNQAELVTSPSLYGWNLFRRQIVSIGDVSGPLELDEIKKLHPDDIEILQKTISALEAGSINKNASKEVTQRGRTEADTEHS